MNTLLLTFVLLGPPPELRAPAPHLEGVSWVMDASVDGKLKQDKPATLTIKATTRIGFHVNEDYPNRFTADTGGDFEQPRYELGNGLTLGRCDEDGMRKCAVTVKAKFTPRGHGSMLIGGVLALGTCDQEQCLIDKIPVLLQVNVAQ